MPDGKGKSRSMRRVQRRTPSGKVVEHLVRRAPGRAQCANCGNYLAGVPRVHSNELKHMSRSMKRPERPYGGMFCSKCTRMTIAQKVRNLFSLSK